MVELREDNEREITLCDRIQIYIDLCYYKATPQIAWCKCVNFVVRLNVTIGGLELFQWGGGGGGRGSESDARGDLVISPPII